MAIDLLCLGEAMVEFNQSEDDGRFLQGFGGDTSNVAIAAARQGVPTGYISAVGTDVFGDMLCDLWTREGVSIDHVRRNADAPTGLYFVTHGPEGHEFSYRRAGSAASLMTPSELPATALADAKGLHVSAISQAISSSACDAVFAAIDQVKLSEGFVSYDTNLRLKLWPLDRARAIIHATAEKADILLPGLDDAMLLTGLSTPQDIVRFYLDLGVGIVALTLGDKGVHVATPGRQERIEPYQVAAVDATGAGDAFDGAFLAEYLATGDPFRAAAYANAAAALSVQGYGAVAPIPDRAAVEAFLRTTP